jgi:GNAT superfamily N-acetyltransferase
MPALQIPLTPEQFQQLPRNPSYRYEYRNGRAWLTPRARFYHARKDLRARDTPRDLEPVGPLELAPVRDVDFEALESVFRWAFARAQPFAGLAEQTLREAARTCLEKTRTGGDGPWVRQASFQARVPGEAGCAGAVLITLLPEGEATAYDSYYWHDEAPLNLLEQRGGRPHLTWIFVEPPRAGFGIGTALLEGACAALRRLGYHELFSTFVAGNDASTLWHWRNGFELLSYPLSARRLKKEWMERREQQ